MKNSIKMIKSILPFKKKILLITYLSLAFFHLSIGQNYYVSTNGVDTLARDGESVESAWKTLSYACERSPEGSTIVLGAGTFIESKSSFPKNGVTIKGVDSASTIIKPSTQWVVDPSPRKNIKTEYLVVLERRSNIKINNLKFVCDTPFYINGAIYAIYSKNIEINHLKVEEFRWAGVFLRECSFVKIHDSYFLNAAQQRDGESSGLIRSRYLSNSEIYDNIIKTTYKDGYGYKASGHRNTKIYRNYIDVNYFGIESAHENEYGLEIFENTITRCISIPKGGPQDNPANSGHKYSVWIHDNHLSDSYTVEGPRNYLRINNNYINIKKTNGRVYTQHGGVTYGPVWIDHNVIVNVDRAFVWKNQGTAHNHYIYNNTVFCANAADRTGSILSVPGDVKNWVFKNNIVVCPDDKPRSLFGSKVLADSVLFASNNVFMNVNNVTGSGVINNFTGQDPMLAMSGEIPFPYYAPKDETSFVVDKGLDVGFPYVGNAPDIGAYELDIVTTVVHEETVSNKLLLFPNPIEDHLTLSGNYALIIKKLSIYNISGVVLLEKHVKNELSITLTLHDLPYGLYLLKAEDIYGTITTKVFVKN